VTSIFRVKRMALVRVLTGTDTDYIAVDSVRRSVRARHQAPCGLMTRFSLHW